MNELTEKERGSGQRGEGGSKIRGEDVYIKKRKEGASLTRRHVALN